MTELATRVLSPSHLRRLTEHGEERPAEAGETLYEIGDRSYPFVAIVDGEVAVLDGACHEIVRHGPSGFLGELNMLSLGQRLVGRWNVWRPAIEAAHGSGAYPMFERLATKMGRALAPPRS